MTLEELTKREKEIQTRLEELTSELNDESKDVNLEEVNKEIDELKKELEKIKLEKIKLEEELEKEDEPQEIEGRQLKEITKETRMKKELRDILSSKEYTRAWAKTMLGQNLTEAEERALGDAVNTTATEFVASTDSVQGVNNAGLFIPTEVITNIFNKVENVSPFYRDIKKLKVASNLNFPYIEDADDSEWYSELELTKNEGVKYGALKLTGNELAKNVEITWKLEKMAVSSFIDFITEEMADKIGKALVKAVLYGDGKGKATGALNGVKAVSGTNAIEAIKAGLKSLSQANQIGAKAYVSSAINIDLVGYQDKNGNYPLIQGVNTNKLLNIEVEPYLEAGDVLIGNPNNYVFNTVENLNIIKDIDVKKRTTTFAGYGIFDGKPKPSAFAKANITPAA